MSKNKQQEIIERIKQRSEHESNSVGPQKQLLNQQFQIQCKSIQKPVKLIPPINQKQIDSYSQNLQQLQQYPQQIYPVYLYSHNNSPVQTPRQIKLDENKMVPISKQLKLNERDQNEKFKKSKIITNNNNNVNNNQIQGNINFQKESDIGLKKLSEQIFINSAINSDLDNQQQQQMNEYQVQQLEQLEYLQKQYKKQFQQAKQEELLYKQNKRDENLKNNTVNYLKQKINQQLNCYSILFSQDYVNNKIPKEKQFNVKVAQYRDTLALINYSNNIQLVPNPDSQKPIYKYYIGRGNNNQLIQQLLKQRWWWSKGDYKDRESGSINFMWTQLKNQDFMENQKINQENNPKNEQNQNKNNNILSGTKNSLQSTTYTKVDDNISENGEQIEILNKTQQSDKEKQQEQSLQQENKQINNNNNKAQNKKNPYVNQNQLNQEIFQKILNSDDIQILESLKLRKKQTEMSDLNTTQYKPKMSLNEQQKKLLGDVQKQFFSGNESNILQKKTTKLQTQIISDLQNQKMHNHLECAYHLGNKKALFYNMRNYYQSNNQDVFQYLPFTFHIKNGKNDPEYQTFIDHFNRIDQEKQEKIEKEQPIKDQNIWIIKPGENTNRGHGVSVYNDLQEIKSVLSQNETHKNGSQKTYIVQKYIDNPLLYNKRKFDIRCYKLITCVNGIVKAYWYEEGYIRTSSKEFSTKNLNKFIHLTNDAVQKKDESYGKFEKGNKIPFDDLNKYIQTQLNRPDIDFYKDIYPQMVNIATDMVTATWNKLDTNLRENNFELMGLDFMIDDNFKVWLIESNTNPDISIQSSSLLSKIIPNLIDNVFKIVLDPIFPPPNFTNPKKLPSEAFFENNKFQLIFDQQQVIQNQSSEEQKQDWGLIEEEEEIEEQDEEENNSLEN